MNGTSQRERVKRHTLSGRSTFSRSSAAPSSATWLPRLFFVAVALSSLFPSYKTINKDTTQGTMGAHTMLPRCEGKFQKTAAMKSQRIHPPLCGLTVRGPDLVALHEAIIDKRL